LKRVVKEGERPIVLQLIARRFGPLPDPIRERVKKVRGLKLERLALRVLNACSVDELMSAKSANPRNSVSPAR